MTRPQLMRTAPSVVAAAAVAALVTGIGLPVAQAQPFSPDTRITHGSTVRHLHVGANGETDTTVCADPVPGKTATCFAHLRIDPKARAARPREAGGIAPAGSYGDNGGYTPAYLQSAYNVASAAATTGSDQTVAIVIAYDDPSAEQDLATYRSTYGLPPCTTANGCFRKVNQSAGTSYPAPDSDWGLESALDVDMVSAICPLCHILLV